MTTPADTWADEIMAELPNCGPASDDWGDGDAYWGGCPTCERHDGYINIGRGHWFYCAEHKVCWWVGSNLFSSWKDQTDAEQRAEYDAVGFEGMREIKPKHVCPSGCTCTYT